MKVVDGPELGLTIPPGAFVVHDGLTGTALAKASAPLAEKARVEPSATVADEGLTVIVLSGPAMTVTDMLAEVQPEEVAVRLALPAVVPRNQKLPAVIEPVPGHIGTEELHGPEDDVVETPPDEALMVTDIPLGALLVRLTVMVGAGEPAWSVGTLLGLKVSDPAAGAWNALMPLGVPRPVGPL